jgi:transposase
MSNWYQPGSAKNRPSQQSCAHSLSWQMHCCATVENGMDTPLYQYGYSATYSSPAGQWVSEYTSAAALMNGLPKAEWLLVETGYDADWLRQVLIDKGKEPCIQGRKLRKKEVKDDKRRHKRRNRIERIFGRTKDWRRVATRYDRCPKVLLQAIALAATVIFWL